MRKLLAFMACSAAATAVAQTRPTDAQFDIQLFYPSPGVRSFFATESGDINPHLTFSAGLNINYSKDPLSVRIVDSSGNEEPVGRVIENRIDFNVMASFGLFDYVDVGIVFPMVVQGGFQGDALGAVGLQGILGAPADFTQGDLRVIPKIRPFSLGDGVFAMSIIPTVIIPTGLGAEWASERNVTFAPSIALSSRFSIMHIALQAGYKWRDTPTEIATVVIKDEIFASLAAAVTLGFIDGLPIDIIGEVLGRTPALNPFGLATENEEERRFQQVRTTIEGNLGLRFKVLDSMLIGVGGGGGLTPGFGAPAPRVFLDLKYYLGDAGPSDKDGDGVYDENDKCPDRKEDIDGFQDEDGCPEFDNDKDNVLDEDDQCPNEKEDRDGFEDSDGCPDPDNDQDGIPDTEDECPLQAEDLDGFEDDDGCPDLDNDGDNIADKVDQCPNEPEDMDGYLDYDGCPEPDNDGDGLNDINDLCPNHAEDMDGVVDDDGCPEDNDGDGIADADDKCPDQAETYNGIDDEDGCPEKLKTKSLVEVTEEKIEIKETIFFKTNKSEILSKSFNLLDQVASVLKNYKHISKVRVEGHTDNKGNKRKNMKLSQDRADEVKRYLVNKGVDANRLESVGYGPDRPIASNKTNRGREQNRRVEFVIVEQKPLGKDVAEGQAPPPAPAEPAVDINLEVPGMKPGGGGTAPSGDGGIESPLFEVGPEPAEPPPPPEADDDKKGKGKKGKGKKGKKKDDEGQIEFNF